MNPEEAEGRDYIKEAKDALSRVLGPELTEVMTAITSDPEGDNDYFVTLPEKYDVDLSIEDLMGLVARTANSYHRIARFAGMAKAQHVLAESEYKHKYRMNSVGRNEAERVRAASEATESEREALATVEAIHAMSEKLENIARIKSESTRKVLDKAERMILASVREERGGMNYNHKGSSDSGQPFKNLHIY